MTRYILRPAPGIAAHLYDVYADDGTLHGRIRRPQPDLWCFTGGKPNGLMTHVDAPSLPALRIAMRKHAAQEAAQR